MQQWGRPMPFWATKKNPPGILGYSIVFTKPNKSCVLFLCYFKMINDYGILKVHTQFFIL